MMFSVDFDIKFVMKKSAPPSGINPPDEGAKILDGGVALTQGEDVKFHRVNDS